MDEKIDKKFIVLQLILILLAAIFGGITAIGGVIIQNELSKEITVIVSGLFITLTSYLLVVM